jgi:hypothetical protein
MLFIHDADPVNRSWFPRGACAKKNFFYTEESDIIIIAWFIYTFNSRLAELQRVYKQILIKITYNIIYINYTLCV